MLQLKKIVKESDFDEKLTRESFVDFLFTHLDKFGDPKQAINKCIDYAFGKENAKGGFCIAAFYDGKLVGALIMNETGMGGYIPENVLVYVAVDASYRGKGFGREIVEKSIAMTNGDVKLHVEYDNPAKRLYERIGFTTKYAEMRFNK
ncbi:MAG: GNAT family N-acetyltransferase [Melioribacteraceae bacterium]|nr:GNAT family N-acetyltransferase [Melioribacteraceae bacterium]MCF8265068.1 GNAT family N-acetyltransferase [Melioribacteraceae bacterium]MCF8413906.1 GNAT family N-acetyltransferase [Melioribacteraceae bacterium]MCF8431964.1 GNAT family N-acetyltransferase [Melioribacteraceae bacterium]